MTAKEALDIIAKERPCPHDAWEAERGSARCADCGVNFTPNQRAAAKKKTAEFDRAMRIITKLVEGER